MHLSRPEPVSRLVYPFVCHLTYEAVAMLPHQPWAGRRAASGAEEGHEQEPEEQSSSRPINDLVLPFARVEFCTFSAELHGTLDALSCAMQSALVGGKPDETFVALAWGKPRVALGPHWHCSHQTHEVFIQIRVSSFSAL